MSNLSRQVDGKFASLSGTPVYLGVITATTTQNNHDTAAAFNNTGDALKAKTLLIQPDVACYVRAGTANTVTATNTALKLEANEKLVISMALTYGWLAALPVAGTVNLRVYELV